jgi:O-antigen/teichoic acid export membrane protein
MPPDVPTTAVLVTGEAQSQPPHSRHHLQRRLLSGSAIMLLSSVFVGGMNLIYNFAVAHKLGAGKFGHASVVYTLLMLLSSVTLSFQLVCSKYVARSGSVDERVAIYRLLHRRAWVAGIAVGAALALVSSSITRYLNLPSNDFVLILAAGIVFYVPLGVRRGFMQGTYDFVPLATNFALEVIVKLIGAVVLISAGYDVKGVVGAITASVVVAYFVGIPRKHHMPGNVPQTNLRSGLGEGVQAITFFVGQVIINNLDIVLVKHFFDASQAGVYAAIALVGRVVYMLSWSVVSSMFPFSAGIRAGGKGARTVLTTALSLVALISTLFTLGAWLAPPGLWHVLLGAGFPAEGHRFYSSLLVLYAVNTALYALAVVLMTYEISRKIGNVSWMQLGFSGAIILGIYLFHGTLQSVITVQLVLMMVLLLLVSMPFLRNASPAGSHAEPLVSQFSGLKKLRQVDENEVIAEFLKSEFYQEEFSRYREPFASLVNNPDLTDERDNALRRALLFRRRGRLWREIPSDTEWWEVELSPEDVKRVRVFARNQWLRYATPGFLLSDVAEKIRDRILSHSRDLFIGKLRSLSIEMTLNAQYSSVILITVNPLTPLTILEGNHRMMAAALVSPETVHQRFRFLCGFSPRMAECCWYRTDLSTLWRYALNTVAYYLIDRRKLTTAILEGEAPSSPSSGANAT